jgi:hypothetical protein
MYKAKGEIFKRKCLKCNKDMHTFCPNKYYCGKQSTKTGCAYKRQLEKVAKWNNEHKDRMKVYNIKAVKKYHDTKTNILRNKVLSKTSIKI